MMPNEAACIATEQTDDGLYETLEISIRTRKRHG
jgi:hypothetical protein